MITKTTEPIIDGVVVVGTKVEYRFFGILFYKKTLYTPDKYGIKEYYYQTSI